MKKTHLVFLLVLVSTLLVDQLLWAKVYIDIRSPSFRKFPIALAPFKGSGSFRAGHETGGPGQGDLEGGFGPFAGFSR